VGCQVQSDLHAVQFGGLSNRRMKRILLLIVSLLAAGAALVVLTLRLNTAARERAALEVRSEELRHDNAALQEKLAKAIQAAENDPRSAEIARLRAELSALRRQHAQAVAEANRMRETVRTAGQTQSGSEQQAELAPDPEREAAKTIGIAKMNYGRHWALAFILYAQEHGGRMPATLEEAAPFFAKDGSGSMPPTVLDPASLSFNVTTGAADAPTTTVIRPDQFEIMYQGSIDQVPDPAKTIILREKEPFPALHRPGLSRTYVFADGHSEIHLASDGDFTAWEHDRLVRGSGP
jgi:hypothetical protein